MKFKILLAAALTMTSALAGGEGWSPDFAASKKLAADGKKDLLVDFTGSDWCSWCIKLNKEVFSHDEFKTGVKDTFVLVELDYPRDKSKLSEATVKQNEELVKAYPIKGYPTILLLDPEGKPFAATGYQPGGPEKYVEQLNTLRAQKATRDAAFAKAAEAKGVEKAKQLVAALKALNLDDELTAVAYKDVAEQIKASDPADETGFTKKAESKKRLADFNEKLGEFQKKQDQPGAIAFMDETLAAKDLPVELFQHIHGHKAAFMMYSKKPAEAAKILEEGISAAPDSEIGQQLKQFLTLVNKEKDKAASSSEAAPDKDTTPAKDEDKKVPAAQIK